MKMKKLLLALTLALLLSGCVMSITPDNIEFIVYDGEPTWAESAESWAEYERTHK